METNVKNIPKQILVFLVSSIYKLDTSIKFNLLRMDSPSFYQLLNITLVVQNINSHSYVTSLHYLLSHINKRQFSSIFKFFSETKSRE